MMTGSTKNPRRQKSTSECHVAAAMGIIRIWCSTSVLSPDIFYSFRTSTNQTRHVWFGLAVALVMKIRANWILYEPLPSIQAISWGILWSHIGNFHPLNHLIWGYYACFQEIVMIKAGSVRFDKASTWNVTHISWCWGTQVEWIKKRRVSWGPFYLHELILASAWTCNPMPGEVWDDITYPFPNFNGATVEVWKLMNKFIPHFILHVIN